MTSRIRQPALVLGVLVAALLALRAAAPLVAPPLPAGPVPATAVVATATRPAVLAGTTGASLLLGGEDGLLRVDIDTRAVRPVPLPGGGSGSDGGLVRGDGTVVAVRGGTAWAAPARPGGRRPGSARPPTRSPRPRPGGSGWSSRPATPTAGSGCARSPSGGPGAQAPVVARGTLPLGRRPVAGVPGGLLVDLVGRGGGLAVWNPRTGQASLRLRAAAPVAVVAASRGTVAWVEGATLHLGDLASGQARVVPPPAGSDGFAPAGAFSPDGRLLAAVTQVGFSTRPALAARPGGPGPGGAGRRVRRGAVGPLLALPGLGARRRLGVLQPPRAGVRHRRLPRRPPAGGHRPP